MPAKISFPFGSTNSAQNYQALARSLPEQTFSLAPPSELSPKTPLLERLRKIWRSFCSLFESIFNYFKNCGTTQKIKETHFEKIPSRKETIPKRSPIVDLAKASPPIPFKIDPTVKDLINPDRNTTSKSRLSSTLEPLEESGTRQKALTISLSGAQDHSREAARDQDQEPRGKIDAVKNQPVKLLQITAPLPVKDNSIDLQEKNPSSKPKPNAIQVKQNPPFGTYAEGTWGYALAKGDIDKFREKIAQVLAKADTVAFINANSSKQNFSEFTMLAMKKENAEFHKIVKKALNHNPPLFNNGEPLSPEETERTKKELQLLGKDLSRQYKFLSLISESCCVIYSRFLESPENEYLRSKGIFVDKGLSKDAFKVAMTFSLTPEDFLVLKRNPDPFVRRRVFKSLSEFVCRYKDSISPPLESENCESEAMTEGEREIEEIREAMARHDFSLQTDLIAKLKEKGMDLDEAFYLFKHDFRDLFALVGATIVKTGTANI